MRFKIKRNEEVRMEGRGVRQEEVENKAECESESVSRVENHIHKSIRHLFIIPERAPM